MNSRNFKIMSLFIRVSSHTFFKLSLITLPQVVPNPFFHWYTNWYKCFWWNPRVFRPCIDSNPTTRFKAQNVVRTSLKLSMWHQWFNPNFMKQREYFLCAKKANITLFNNFFPSVSVFAARSQQYHDWCHMDYCNDVFTSSLGLECVSCVAFYAGSENSRNSAEIS